MNKKPARDHRAGFLLPLRVQIPVKPPVTPDEDRGAYFFFVTRGFGSGFKACGSKPI